jgi:hypothetical protein
MIGECGSRAEFEGKCLGAMEELILIELRIYNYQLEYGRHPRLLSELDLKRPSNKTLEMVDPWDEPFVYVWFPSGYLLYSKGGDRLDGTNDDIASGDVFWCWRGPYGASCQDGGDPDPDARLRPRTTFRARSVFCGTFAAERCATAWDVMDELRKGIERIREMSGRYPIALTDLHSAGVWIDPPFEDPWGEKYVYRRMDAGYELYSNGNDMRARTEDDLVVGFDKGICKQAPYWEGVEGDKDDSQPSSSAVSGRCGCSFVGR